MVSNARLDLPDPESPVTTTRRSRGISSEMFLRLCTRVPCTAIVVRGCLPCRSDSGRRLTVEAGPAPCMKGEFLHVGVAHPGETRGDRGFADAPLIGQVLHAVVTPLTLNCRVKWFSISSPNAPRRPHAGSRSSARRADRHARRRRRSTASRAACTLPRRLLRVEHLGVDDLEELRIQRSACGITSRSASSPRLMISIWASGVAAQRIHSAA